MEQNAFFLQQLFYNNIQKNENNEVVCTKKCSLFVNRSNPLTLPGQMKTAIYFFQMPIFQHQQDKWPIRWYKNVCESLQVMFFLHFSASVCVRLGVNILLALNIGYQRSNFFPRKLHPSNGDTEYFLTNRKKRLNIYP